MLSLSLVRTLLFGRRIWCWVRRLVLKSAFKRCGTNVSFNPDDVFSYQNIEIGNDVFIGPGANIQATETGVVIGNKVMLGPNVCILGGDHNFSEIGQFMFDVKEKRPDDDQTVIIEDDVWIGAGAIILKGTCLGRGCIVAAGSIVTKSVPPYTIVMGVPAVAKSLRFPMETILAHEEQLYPPNRRLSSEYLEASLIRTNSKEW